LVQTFWNTLIFDVVSGDFVDVDMLAGVRLLDKSRNDSGNFRIEIWTKFADEKSEMGQNQIKYLREKFIDAIKREDGYDLGARDANEAIVFKVHQQQHSHK